MTSTRRNYRYWLSPGVGYPTPNRENVKMLVDALRAVAIQTEPLTIDELNGLYEALESRTILSICRAVERAHGITTESVMVPDNQHRYEMEL